MDMDKDTPTSVVNESASQLDQGNYMYDGHHMTELNGTIMVGR